MFHSPAGHPARLGRVASTVNYWLRMRRARPADFTLERAERLDRREELEGAAS